MFLIEFFLPTSDNDGSPFPRDEFDRIRRELTERFGGVTAFTRSPATGLWTDETGQVRPDELFRASNNPERWIATGGTNTESN